MGALYVAFQIPGVVKLAATDVTWKRAYGGEKSVRVKSKVERNREWEIEKWWETRGPCRGLKSGAVSRA